MTNERRQRILCLITDDQGEYYYNGPLDGIWGPESQNAADRFLRDFNGEADPDVTDSNVGDNSSPTGTFWDEIEFFDRDEFRCQCGGKYCDGFHVEPEEMMVRICDEIRRRAGVPILIREAGGSGLRCPQHNASIPGAAANSEHIYGRAADLHPRGKTPAQLYAIADEVMAEMIPGRGGLGLYNWGIHVDTGTYSRWNG